MKPPFLVAAAIAYVGVGGYSTVSAAEQKTVLLVEGPKERIDMNRLKEAALAHMSDLDAKVEVKTVIDMPTDPKTRLETMRALLGETQALAVVWIEYESDNLMLLVSESGTEQMLTQAFPGRLNDEEQILDAAAAVIRSALTPWFASDEPEAAPLSVDTRTQETESKANTEGNGRRVQKHPAPRLPRAAVFGGYALAVNLDDAPQSGGSIGADVGAFRYARLGIDFRIFQPASMNVEHRDIRLLRMLPAPWVGFCPTFGAASLCLKAKLIFDIDRVLGANPDEAPSRVNRMRLGFSPSVSIRYRPLSQFGIDLEIGADFFGEPYHYRWNGEIVFTNGRIQPTASLCLSFLFPKQKEAER